MFSLIILYLKVNYNLIFKNNVLQKYHYLIMCDYPLNIF